MNIETARKSYYDYWYGMTKIYEDWAQKYHMSGNSMFILQIIWEYSGKVTQKDICEALLLPKQTVNSILKTYEKSKWVSFEALESDRRNKAVFLTEAGEKVCSEIFPKLIGMEEKAMEQMGADQCRKMTEYNNHFLEILKGLMEDSEK